MKRCFRCERDLPILEFYPHPKMTDGHLGKCRDCTRADSEKRRHIKEQNPEWHEREYQRMLDKAKRLNKKFPEKQVARNAIRKLGRDKAWNLHHWSYLAEHHLDVIRLTPNQHRRVHTYLRYDQDFKMYRRLDNGELLDSKLAHVDFIFSILNLRELNEQG